MLKRNLTVSCIGKCITWGKATGIGFSNMRSKGSRNMEEKVWPTNPEQLPNSGTHTVNKEREAANL